MAARRYTLDGQVVDVAEFMADNGFDAEEQAEIWDMQPGDTLSFGGGAAPLFVLSCEATEYDCDMCGLRTPAGTQCEECEERLPRNSAGPVWACHGCGLRTSVASDYGVCPPCVRQFEAAIDAD